MYVVLVVLADTPLGILARPSRIHLWPGCSRRRRFSTEKILHRDRHHKRGQRGGDFDYRHNSSSCTRVWTVRRRSCCSHPHRREVCAFPGVSILRQEEQYRTSNALHIERISSGKSWLAELRQRRAAGDITRFHSELLLAGSRNPSSRRPASDAREQQAITCHVLTSQHCCHVQAASREAALRRVIQEHDRAKGSFACGYRRKIRCI